MSSLAGVLGMILQVSKLIAFSVFLASSCLYASTGISDGFDYPFGDKGYDSDNERRVVLEYINAQGEDSLLNRGYGLYKNLPESKYNKRFGEPNNSGAWYNHNDVGNYDFSGQGLHPGEDWKNTTAGGSAGKAVFSIANGEIIRSIPVGSSSEHGHCIVIKHLIPKGKTVFPYSGGRFTFGNYPAAIYSTYFHVSAVDETSINNYPYVSRGEKIAEVYKMQDAHLHLEISTKDNACSYPNGSKYTGSNLSGYYNHGDPPVPTSETKGEVHTIAAMERMKLDGLLDPSDFIAANRRLSDSNTSCLFSDVQEGSTYYSTIQALCEKGFIDGYSSGNVVVDGKMNRAEFIKVAALVHADDKGVALEWNCEENDPVFADVQYSTNAVSANSDWFCHYAKYAKSEKIAEGDQQRDGTSCLFQGNDHLNVFCPGKPVSYHEAAKVILTSLFGVIPKDEYWFNGDARNNDGTAKDESYIGCADKMSLFSVRPDQQRVSNGLFGVSDRENYYVYDEVTRGDAFMAIYNSMNKRSEYNCSLETNE